MRDLRRKTFIYAAGTLLVYILLFLFADRSVDTWIRSNCAHTWLSELGRFFSYFGDGSAIRLGVALSFLLIVALNSDTRKPWLKSLLYVCVSCAIAIVVGEGLKYLLARHRPIMLFNDNLYGLSFLSSEWAFNSTPSGHTLRVFAILTALSIRFRRMTAVFITFAALIGISRVLVTDHYPSDVLFGAFIGIFSALWTYRFFYSSREVTDE
ncbi:MAG: phosphatase PAP2 family protein [Candidatus Fermentibacteria bacterium]